MLHWNVLAFKWRIYGFAWIVPVSNHMFHAHYFYILDTIYIALNEKFYLNFIIFPQYYCSEIYIVLKPNSDFCITSALDTVIRFLAASKNSKYIYSTIYLLSSQFNQLEDEKKNVKRKKIIALQAI